MKFSTRARYGLRLCFLIGLSLDTVSLSTLCNQSEISEKYAEQILARLKKANILHSQRGVNGGYSLSRPAAEISISAILDALDDNFEFSCDSTCKDVYCPNKKIFRKLSQSISDVFSNTTLKDMIDDYKCV